MEPLYKNNLSSENCSSYVEYVSLPNNNLSVSHEHFAVLIKISRMGKSGRVLKLLIFPPLPWRCQLSWCSWFPCQINTNVIKLSVDLQGLKRDCSLTRRQLRATPTQSKYLHDGLTQSRTPWWTSVICGPVGPVMHEVELQKPSSCI